VDAALDVTNVARVAHYIRDKTRGRGATVLGGMNARGRVHQRAGGAKDLDGGDQDLLLDDDGAGHGEGEGEGRAMADVVTPCFQSIVISLKVRRCLLAGMEECLCGACACADHRSC
jgi:hypothetical protein